jgi:anti-anti-sigma regulatory factor
MVPRRNLALMFVIANLALGGYLAARRYSSGAKPGVVASSRAQTVSPELVESFNAMNARGLLSQLHESAARSSSGKAVVVMFSSVCSSCPTGHLVKMLEASSQANKDVAFLVLLPDSFNRTDVENFHINLESTLPVERANTPLSREWMALNEKYGERAMNGTVMLVGGGNVISLAQGLDKTGALLGELSK